VFALGWRSKNRTQTTLSFLVFGKKGPLSYLVFGKKGPLSQEALPGSQ
jgi:hypothetical protein